MINRQSLVSKALLALALLFLGGVGLSELEKLDFQKAIQSVFQRNLEQTLNLNSNSEKGLEVFRRIINEPQKSSAVMVKVSYESWIPQPITKKELCKRKGGAKNDFSKCCKKWRLLYKA